MGDSIKEAISFGYAILSCLPPVSFFLIWILVYAIVGNKKKTTRIAVHLTTLTLIGSVFVMFRLLLHSGIAFWIYILLALLSAGWIGREQTRKKGKVNIRKILAVISGASFLILVPCFVLLTIIGIVRYMTAG